MGLRSTVIFFAAAILSVRSICGQVSEAGGVAVFEAENFSANLPGTLSPPHSWTFGNSTAGFGGTGYMEALPNTGTPGNADSSTPQLQFTVNFTSTVVDDGTQTGGFPAASRFYRVTVP